MKKQFNSLLVYEKLKKNKKGLKNKIKALVSKTNLFLKIK